MPGSTPEGPDSSPAGWIRGCRPQDNEWVSTYCIDFPDDPSNPIDALPPGYEAYLAVLHQLEDAAGPRAWLCGDVSEPWTQVRRIVDDGLNGWPYAADVEIGPPQSGVLVEALGLLTGSVRYTCRFFAATDRVCTLTGPALARALNGEEGVAPDLWFPHDLSWVASAPYDAGWTYFACEHMIADRLAENPALEVLRCSFDR